jgi:flavin reductase (DIM6/NTAB) family NADH-FMN oxidoreductase RutF
MSCDVKAALFVRIVASHGGMSYLSMSSCPREGIMQEISWNEALEWGSPYPYALATTVGKDGRPNIIGLAWWTIVSWDPQMIAISVGHGRYSHECLEHRGEFVLCLPAEEQKDGAWLCGTTTGRKIDKFSAGGFQQVPAKVVAPPLIEGSTVAYECKVANTVAAGDHTLFIGEVVAIHGSPERTRHLYTVHYRKVVSIDCKGHCNFDL